MLSIRWHAIRSSGIALLLLLTVVVAAQEVPVGERPVDMVDPDVETRENTTRKIVGGTFAPAGKYSFQVALIASKTAVGREHFGQFCGGVLIDKRWVLTAAHCVPNTKAEEVDVYIGSTVLPAGEGNAGGKAGHRRHLTDIIEHPTYDHASHDNDVALLELTEDAPADFTPAVLPTVDLVKKFGSVGSDVVVIGWGRTKEGGKRTPKLKEVTVAVQNPKVCQKNYAAVVPSAKITANMFCAGRTDRKADSCQGDSGGFIGAAVDKKSHVVLGVVSWGIGCARPGLFGVYTHIANFREFIVNVMKDH